MPGKILLPQDMSKIGKDYLTERGYEIVMGSGTDEASMMKDIVDCDGLIIRVPPVTANILRAGKKLKPTACLVNCARGDLVDEEALCEALSEQKIRGAALDVFAESELPGDHPLTKLDNVILTPHCASHTQEGLDKMALHAAMGVDEVLSGKPITWPIN